MTTFFRSMTLLAVVLLSVTRAVATPQSFTLVYAAELPLSDDANGSYAELATLLERTRQHHPTVFLFGGDSLAPSHLSSLDRGAHIIDILNSLEPDAMGVAKRELSFLEDELSLRAYEAAFPLVLTNATDSVTQSNIDGVKTHLLIHRNAVKIGVLVALHESASDEYRLNRLQIDSTADALTDHAEQLRRDGADVIILMVSDPHPYLNGLLNDAIVDLVLRTEPHVSPIRDSDAVRTPGYVLITRPNTAAVIHFNIPDSGTEDMTISVNNVALSELAPAPAIQAQINAYNQGISGLLNEEITQLTAPMNTGRFAVRSAENAFGNLVSDSLREASHTDIALINGGAIRGERQYQAGHVLTRKDIATELPFRSHIKVLKITGEQLLAALENGVSRIEKNAGRFPHVSGMRFDVDVSAPPGRRVRNLTINGTAVKQNAVYTLATSDFIAGGGDGYTSMTHATEVPFSQQVTPLIADVVISVLRRQPQLKPSRGGRITLLNDDNGGANDAS